MSDKSVETLNRIFRALASEPRRRILQRAARQQCAITQFAAELKMSQPAVSKHVRVLVDAELLSKSRNGRYRWCRFNRGALELAQESIDALTGVQSGGRRTKRAGSHIGQPFGRKNSVGCGGA